MSECLSDNAIAEFVGGLATPDETQRIEAHVARCGACRRLLSQLAGAIEPPPVADDSGGEPIPEPGVDPDVDPVEHPPTTRDPAPTPTRQRRRSAVVVLSLLLAVAAAGLTPFLVRPWRAPYRAIPDGAAGRAFAEALALTQRFDEEHAADAWARAVAAAPDHAASHAQLAASLARLGRRRAALVESARAIALTTDALPADARREVESQALLAAHDFARALPLLRARAEAAPGDRALGLQVADAEAANGDPAAAFARIAKLRALGEDPSAAASSGNASIDLDLGEARVAIAAGDWLRAQRSTDAALARAGTHPAPAIAAPAYRLASAAQLALGFPKRALASAAAAFQQATALGDPDAEIDALLAFGVAQSTEPERAQASFERALAHARERGRTGRAAQALANLAALAEQQHRGDESARLWAAWRALATQ